MWTRRLLPRLIPVLGVALLAGCGGGGGGGGGNDPPAPEKLDVAFVADNTFLHGPESAQPGQSLMIKSASEFAAIPPARYPDQLPAGFKEPDYAKNYLLYLDGKSIDIDIWNGGVRIERIESNADGKHHIVFAELCLRDMGGSFGFPMFARPYAFYTTNRIEGTVEVRWTERIDPNCVAYEHRGKLEVAFAGEASLTFVPGADTTGVSVLVKSASEFATITPAQHPHLLPAGFKEPDYTRNYLLYLTHKSLRAAEWTGWTRIERVESSADHKSHIVHAELCLRAVSDDFPENPPYRPYAFYTTNRIEGTVEVRWTERIDPNCVAYKPRTG